MTTKEQIRRAASLLLSLVVAAPAATTASASSAGRVALPLRIVSAFHSTASRRWTYDWPVKPFDRQHSVRGFLNDPRIGDQGSRAFHFGIDICARDGTAVYAVEAGTVYFDSPRAIAVVSPDRSHSFGYWHIVPVVKSHQLVRRHALLGYVAKTWGHVHFAERRNGVYVNPLRDGGIGPYVDTAVPTVNSVWVEDGALVADVADTPSPVVSGSWENEPVTPALLRWRIGSGVWRTAVDFRSAMLPASRFSLVYAPETRQNHEGVAGRFVMYLTHRLDVPNGTTVEVEAADAAGNRVVVSAALDA